MLPNRNRPWPPPPRRALVRRSLRQHRLSVVPNRPLLRPDLRRRNRLRHPLLLVSSVPRQPGAQVSSERLVLSPHSSALLSRLRRPSRAHHSDLECPQLQQQQPASMRRSRPQPLRVRRSSVLLLNRRHHPGTTLIFLLPQQAAQVKYHRSPLPPQLHR